MLNVYKETLGYNTYAYYLDSGDDIMGVYICPNSANVYIKYVQIFIYQLYLNKAVKQQNKTKTSCIESETYSEYTNDF